MMFNTFNYENTGFSYELMRKSAYNSEAAKIKKLSACAGIAAIAFILLEAAFSLAISALGLRDLLLNDIYFECAAIGLISVFSILLPHLAVYRFAYGKKQRDACLNYGKPVSSKAFWLAVFAGYMFCSIGELVTGGLTNVASSFGITFTQSELPKAGNLGESIAVTAMVSLIPALVEEFAIRGVIMQPLRRYGNKFAIITSACVFALLHTNIIQVPFAFTAGIALGYFAIATDSIWTSVAIHFLNNFLAGISSVLNDKHENLGTVFYVATTLAGIAAGAVCLKVFIDTPHIRSGFSDRNVTYRKPFFTSAAAFAAIAGAYSFLNIKYATPFFVSAGVMIYFYYKYSQAFDSARPAAGLFLERTTRIYMYLLSPAVIAAASLLMTQTVGSAKPTDVFSIIIMISTVIAAGIFAFVKLSQILSNGLLEKKLAYKFSVAFIIIGCIAVSASIAQV